MFASVKLRKSLLGVLKFSVLIVFLFLVISKVQTLTFSDFRKLAIQSYPYLLLAVLLLFVNWFFEFYKWKVIVTNYTKQSSNRLLLKSLLSGMATGVITPNRVGNFIGRVIHFSKRERGVLTLATLYSNLAQFNATILIGGLSVIAYRAVFFISFSSIGVRFVILGIVILALLTYFVFPFFKVFQVYFFKKYKRILAVFLSKIKVLMFPLMVLSMARFFVFTLQFVLLFMAFGIPFSSLLVGGVLVVFFISTVIPNLVLGKLFIRETIALYVFAGLVNDAVVVAASFSLWIINIGLPSLVGILTFFNVKTIKE